MQNQSKINCPKCGAEIDVQDVLTHQLEDQIKKSYAARYMQDKARYDIQAAELAKEKATFEEVKKKENELFQNRLDVRIREERKQIQIQLSSKLEAEQADKVALMEKELNEKSEKLKELSKTQAEFAKLKREKDELAESLKAHYEEEQNRRLTEEREKVRKSEEVKNEMVLRELQKKLDDQIKLTDEMSRKQKQGSMQTQGEVQELAIEEWLKSKFPLDTIEEIKKGIRGGDCIQTVHTHSKQNCGTIYYESKRTKDFQPTWIEKFKNDIRDRNADIGVLITEAMPQDMDRLGLRDGIWICSYEEFKGLSLVLRESVIRISDAIVTQENRGDKMTLLYDYLTSNEFRLQIEGIFEGFIQMKSDLETEKRSITSHWKKREKQIEKVLLNTNYMYSSLRGIAGSAIAPIQALELPEAEETFNIES
jgi:hypothetical protein